MAGFSLHQWEYRNLRVVTHVSTAMSLSQKPPPAEQLMKRPLKVRQFVFATLAIFVALSRTIGLVLSRGSWVSRDVVLLGIVLIAALMGVSAGVVWLLEKHGPAVVRYALRRL
jgi:hypothetical protein